MQESYKAQQEAEMARASMEKAHQQAEQIVKAEIDKERMRIDAEAKAAQTRILQEGQAAAYVMQKQAEADGIQRVAEGEASAIRASAEASGIQAKLTAEAEGTRAQLDAKAQGFEKLLKVADDTAGATQLLIAENIVRIAEIQAGAIKGLQFEKVVVMGGGNGSGGGAGQFVQDLYRGVLPLNARANFRSRQ